MNVIFVGTVYPHEREDEIRQNSKYGIDNASNNLQWALIEGLDYYYPNLTVITQPFIRTFPFRYKKLFFKNSAFSHKEGVSDYCLGFINLHLIKHLVSTINLFKYLHKIIKKGEETTLIIYAIHSPFLKAAINFKKKNDKLKICLIVPDLPQFQSESRNLIYLLLKKIDAVLINKYLKKIDSFVLLSDYMADALKVETRPWTRVEGIFNFNQDLNISTIKEKTKTILYTGNIGERYGIKTLLNAFNLIEDENYRLWIRGDGNTKKNVLDAAKSDARIQYFNEMPKKELFELQKKATVLINPISSNQEFTKYFFSSKTLDYLASGTPTIMTKLKSIPQEYFDYVFIAEREDAEGLKETILKICSKDQAELNEFGEKASQFILENKNPIFQVKKIYDMLIEDSLLVKSPSNHNYQVCTNCIMDSTDANISFDKNGVCDHCHDFNEYVKPNWHLNELGKHELTEIVAKIKASGKGNDFDCLLGMSGGVDSSYMLHLAVKVLGLRPLVFHVDGGWNSELAVHNINVMIDKLGLDLYTEVINWEEMKDFQLAFFKSGVPHLDIPQDHAFVATLYKFAHKYKIKYILNGGNFSTECVQYPMQWFYYGTDLSQINDIRKKFGTNKMESYPFSSVLWHKFYLRYFKGIKVVKPLNYMRYFKAEALALLEKEYGWKPYPQKHFESRFTRFYEGYWLPERFGYDTRKVQLSSLILTGQMTREEALEEMKKPAHNPATIEDEFNYIATKLGIKPEELRHYLTIPKKYYWDYKNQQNIFRLGAKVLHLFGVEKVRKRIK